jgi:hypothetical protein
VDRGVDNGLEGAVAGFVFCDTRGGGGRGEGIEMHDAVVVGDVKVVCPGHGRHGVRGEVSEGVEVGEDVEFVVVGGGGGGVGEAADAVRLYSAS